MKGKSGKAKRDVDKGKYLEVRTEERWVEGGKGQGPGSGNYTFMANDYLLITKGPSHEAGEKKLFHVNFGGLHGVGTRATANFLKKTEWLEESSKKIREHEYYQILLPVNKIHHDSRIRESIPVDFGRPMIHPLSEKKSRSA